MTKREQADMAELGMTPEELEARRIAIAAQIVNPEHHTLETLIDAPVSKPARKPRSDKGVPKPKPAAAEPGTLTREQAAQVRQLVTEIERSREAHVNASADLKNAVRLFNDYLDSLTKTGQQS